MESIVASTSQWKASHVNDPKLRMAARPPSSKPPPSRRTGMAAEDLGSSFGKARSQSQSNSKPGAKTRGRTGVRTPDSGSADELDSLPPHSRAGSEVVAVEDEEDKKKGYTDEKGVHHEFHALFSQDKSTTLKGLKFRKNKTSPRDGEQASTSSSQPIVLKEQGNGQNSGYNRPMPLPQPLRSQPNTRRDVSPTRVTRKRSPSPPRRRNQSAAPTTRVDPPTNSTRPKPRKLVRDTSTTQLVPKTFPGLSPPRSPARRMTISGTPTQPSRHRSPPSKASENSDPGRPVEKLKAAAFPPLSPTKSPSFNPSVSKEPVTAKKGSGKLKGPAEFPSLSTLKPQDSVATKKASGKQTISEKRAVVKPPPAPAEGKKKGSAETRIRKKLSAARRVVSSEESDNDEDDAPKAQPFPMNTQFFGSMESSPVSSGPSSLKRSSPGSYEGPDSKRMREDIVDLTMAVDPDDEVEEVDPSTLCPFCDTPLPSHPTPQLIRLLSIAEKKSYREPRAGNRLGRTAPFTVYISICQRHRFESQMLPEAERKGWPKTIDWTELGKRVRKMKDVLRGIIEDTSEGDSDDLFGDGGGPKTRCVFWKETLAEVKKKGTRAVAGVRGQFATFEKTQPGYYGEMGSVIIHQTLYDLFPPATIDPASIAPLTAGEFLQRILVPEIAARLIMQDTHMDESRMDEAVKVLRESANYGVAMFPADEGEEGEGRDDGKLGAADLILMKRAMKRRKELDADEREEEEEFERQAEEEKEHAKRPRKKAKEDEDEPDKGKGKGKGKGKVKVKEVGSSPPPALPRPKPRPIGKTTSTASLMGDLDMDISASTSKAETDTDNEDAPRPTQSRPKPRRLPSRIGTPDQLAGDTDPEDAPQPVEEPRPRPRRLPSMTVDSDDENPPHPAQNPRPKSRRQESQSNIDIGTDADATPRKVKAHSRASSVDIDLCTSDTPDEWDTGRMKRGQKKHRGKSKTLSVTVDSDEDTVQVDPPPSSRTPLRSSAREKTLSDSEEDTPKPRAKPRSTSYEAPYCDDIPPLQRARERKLKSV
ncbi:hypothetical protein DXG01_008073 [Tephrocybe rancida]|nr:hypothetical protein DXG01_008073 [Tephrocybe rancida]